MMPTMIVRTALAGCLAAMLFSGCSAVAPTPPNNVVAVSPTPAPTKPTSVATAQPANPAETTDPANAVAPGEQPLQVITVDGKPYRTLAFKPTTGYSSVVVADNGKLYLSCGAQKQSETIGVCMIDPKTSSEVFLVDPRKDNAKLGVVTADGDWVVYGRMDDPQRIMAVNALTKEQVEVGKITAGTFGSPVGLTFAISGSKIAWVDEAEDQDKKRVETVMLFDLNDRTSRALTTLKPAFVVDQIDIAGDTAVWSQVDTTDVNDVSSDVYAYDLAKNELRALSETGHASMPQVHDHYVVWKTTATRFAYGSVYLYDLNTNSGKIIAQDDPNGAPVPLGYDMPSIGSNGVTWITSRNERIELYHPDTGQTEVLDQGGGRAFTEGHYMIWVNDSVAQKGDWHVLWSDLSAPTGTAPAAPTTAPTAAPSAAPTTAPTAAPATAVPATPTAVPPAPSAPGGGAPASGWETFSNLGNDYRLRYPAGSARADDELNNAVVFTLTREQTTHTIRVTGPLPIPAGAQSPADVLGAADQNLGSTSTAPQPVTLRGLSNVDYQAAGIVTTMAGQAPCATLKTRTVEIFAQGSSYRLQFEVAGPNQCDATQVALFDEVLQSFELQ